MCNNTDLVLFVAEIMRGLYLITNDDPIELLLAKLEGAMATYEVAVLQYRRKNVPQVGDIDSPSGVANVMLRDEKLWVTADAQINKLNVAPAGDYKVKL